MTKSILTFFNILKIRLKQNLDGEKFHVKFLPKNRIFFSIDDKKVENYRKSAVMMILFNDENHIKSILIQRSSYDGAHSGQISFPGGKFEPSDINLINTAIRETYEEINLKIEPSDIIGSLTPITIPISEFLVYPFVCYLKQKPKFIADNHEVLEVIEYDISSLLKKDAILEREVIVRNQALKVPAFEINNKIVWGATAMMLNEFREITLEIINSNQIDL
jgi:8-oxo-dGTP pyrophosphatase MutT (NUDIX family)